jgi:arylsulfatase A-like enzyme
MKAICILSDSLNRHFLPAYGNSWVQTPNIDRFAEKSLLFTNHWMGSAPCMPARRDIITGRLCFLEREWGGLEPFDRPFPSILRRNGIYSHMETDHHHYFHVGGENYHTTFNTWALHRGQENDRYVSRIDPVEEPEHLGRWTEQYYKNHSAFSDESAFPTPRTFRGAIDWLSANEGADDFFLWVEVFDPHEPFDCPEYYYRLYEDHWSGPLYNWSGYERVDEESAAQEHLKKQYASSLTMMDRWLGKLFDELERQGIFEETLIIFTTDHGHMLGEHGQTGKNNWHVWNEMAHIPLLVHLPGSECGGEERGQLTQNIDIMPSLLEYFGLGDIQRNLPLHGHSLLSAAYENEASKRDAALYGWFGQTVNLSDGSHTYFRAPVSEENSPLYRYFLTHSTIHLHDLKGIEFFKEAELGKFLPYTDFPVIRARVDKHRSEEWEDSRLYSIEDDPGQQLDLSGTALENRYRDLLIETLKRHDAPREQYRRLGLT